MFWCDYTLCIEPCTHCVQSYALHTNGRTRTHIAKIIGILYLVKICMLLCGWFGFATKSNGGHWPPLLYVQIIAMLCSGNICNLLLKPSARTHEHKKCGGTLPTAFLFYIFNFPLSFKSSARRTVARRVYCTVTVIVTLDVLLSTSVTEYVTLYLPFRVVITLPKTSIFDVMSLPQVSTAVTPARA